MFTSKAVTHTKLIINWIFGCGRHQIFFNSPSLGLGLWCWTRLSTIFQLYRCGL